MESHAQFCISRSASQITSMQYQQLSNDWSHEDREGGANKNDVASPPNPTHGPVTSLHLSPNLMSESITREYSVSSLSSSRGSDDPLHPRDGRYEPEHMQSNSPLLASGDIHDTRGAETIDNRSGRIGQDGHERPLQEEALQRTSPSATWMPYTLRWWYMCLVLAATSALLATIAALLAKSRAESGIAADDNSSSLLWGWRYTPTLCKPAPLCELFVRHALTLSTFRCRYLLSVDNNALR
jgi:hypothetical protein